MDRGNTIPLGPAVLVDIYREATDLEIRANRWFGRYRQRNVLFHGQDEGAAASREWANLLGRLLLMMGWLRVQSLGTGSASTTAALTHVLAIASSDDADVSLLPPMAGSLVRESLALYARIIRLDAKRPHSDSAREQQRRLAGILENWVQAPSVACGATETTPT